MITKEAVHVPTVQIELTHYDFAKIYGHAQGHHMDVGQFISRWVSDGCPLNEKSCPPPKSCREKPVQPEEAEVQYKEVSSGAKPKLGLLPLKAVLDEFEQAKEKEEDGLPPGIKKILVQPVASIKLPLPSGSRFLTVGSAPDGENAYLWFALGDEKLGHGWEVWNFSFLILPFLAAQPAFHGILRGWFISKSSAIYCFSSS